MIDPSTTKNVSLPIHYHNRLRLTSGLKLPHTWGLIASLPLEREEERKGQGRKANPNG